MAHHEHTDNRKAAVAGIVVIGVSLVPIVWNVMQLSTLDAEGDFEAWMNIFFALLGTVAGGILFAYARSQRNVRMARWRYGHVLLAAGVVLVVLALLVAWGPPASGVALATLPLLLGCLLSMLFDIPPAEQSQAPSDLEAQRHNVGRLALWNGVLAVAAGLLALAQTVFRSPADTGYAWPLAALFLAISLYHRAETRNPRLHADPSRQAEHTNEA
ncbi:hypothetical protein [Kocuria rosea]|uniref:Uncharacterized protein n=1 Tax=Kocuria rosea TaxID=1275 RepID=A0A4R5YE53_KOCRO|nr:hypothetical protein [Kocuria rosea]TDL42458.1 hypothetical protein E2R59_10965 [Kocuria rosea]